MAEIAVAVVHGGRREIVFDSLVNPERPIPRAIRTSPTSVTKWSGTHPGFPTWPSSCWGRSQAECLWPTTPDSIGTS